MKWTFTDKLILLAIAWLLLGGQIPSWPVIGGGATQFIVLHEPTKDDLAFSDLATELQDSSSPVRKEIDAAGWNVWVLPDDAVDKNDQPLPLLVKLGVHGSINDAHRELFAIAPPDTLIHRETLPATATAETVLASIKAKGKRK